MLKNNLESNLQENLAGGLLGNIIKPTKLRIGANLSGGEASDSATTTFLTRGTAWREPSSETIDYMMGLGLNVFRYPFKMERLQNVKNTALDETFAGYIDDAIEQVTSKGHIIILDPHNYMKRRGADLTSNTSYYMNITTYSSQWNGSSFQDVADTVSVANQFTTADYVDFWTRVADRYKNNNKVYFGLMNEPIVAHTTAELVTIFNSAIAGIRSTGAKNRIFVPLRNYSSAEQAVKEGFAYMIENIVDSQNNYGFEVHEYINNAGGGGGATISQTVSDQIVLHRTATITELARTRGVKLYWGEIGFAETEEWHKSFITFYNFLRNNSDVWEMVTLWTSGENPFVLNGYAYKLNPDSTTPTTDKAQTAFIKKRITLGKNYINPAFDFYWNVSGAKRRVSSHMTFFDFTRASKAWDWKAGLLHEFQAGETRLTERGFRVDPICRNIYSMNDWSARAGYTSVGGASVEGGATPVYYPSPDGNNYAVKLLEGANTASKYVVFGSQNVENASQTHYVSCYYKGYDNAFMWHQASNGANGGALATSLPMQAFTTFRKGDWARAGVAITADTAVKLRIGWEDDATASNSTNPPSFLGLGRSVFATFPQAEQRNFPTTPVIKLASQGVIQRDAEVYDFKDYYIDDIIAGDFTLVLEVQDMPALGVALPILLINGTQALGITTDHKVTGSFGISQTTGIFTMANPATASPNYVASNFRRTPRRYAISVDRTNGRIVIAGQGITAVGANVSVPLITSMVLGQCAGCFSEIGISREFYDVGEIEDLLSFDGVNII